MTITLHAVNELIQSLESAGELSIKERKYLELGKAYVQLAAENVGLNKFITQSCYVFDGEQHEISDAYICATDGGIPETPATDAYLAGIKADGVEEMASTYRGFANEDGCSVNMKCSYNLTAERAESYAAYIRRQLRESIGAQS